MSRRLIQLLCFLLPPGQVSGPWPLTSLSRCCSTGWRSLSSRQTGGRADTTVRPHFMLYVPLGQAPTPFVAPGAFTAEWEGVIQLDLRDRFVFQAELNGSLQTGTQRRGRFGGNIRWGNDRADQAHPAQLPQQHAEGDLHFAARWRRVFSALLGHARLRQRADPAQVFEAFAERTPGQGCGVAARSSTRRRASLFCVPRRRRPRAGMRNWRWTPRRSTASARGGTQAGWPSGFSIRPSSGRRPTCRQCCTVRPPKTQG